jgi:hypothetical protein
VEWPVWTRVICRSMSRSAYDEGTAKLVKKETRTRREHAKSDGFPSIETPVDRLVADRVGFICHDELAELRGER